MHCENQVELRKASRAAAVAVLLSCAAAGTAAAATLRWDANDTTANPDGGSGTWDLTTPNWDDDFGASTPWIQGSTAQFGGGSDGTVTVAAPIQASTIEVTGNRSYTLTGGTITTQGVASFGTVRIDSSLVSSNSFFLNGPSTGTVILNGDNSAMGKNINFGSGTLIVDGNQSANRLPKNAAVAGNGTVTIDIRGRDALPTGADAIDVSGIFGIGGRLRVVSGASAMSGTTLSHAHLRNIHFDGGTIELAYSGTGSAYNGESFQLNGNVQVPSLSIGPAKIVYGPGANAANAGIALAGARTFDVFGAPQPRAALLQVAVELQDGDGSTLPGKLIKIGGGSLSLEAANTYSGGTEVNLGRLLAVVDGALGMGDVRVMGASLTIGASNAIADSAFLFVNGGAVTLNTEVNETVFGLALDGIAQPNGTYGSSASAAQFKNNQFFSGTGILTVVPEPGALAVATGMLAMSWRRRCRRRQRPA